jgi:Spy/CpxP family protein refolding chaperone
MMVSRFEFASSRRAIALGALFVSGALAVEARAVEAPVTVDQAASELMEHHRHHHHGGVTQFIAMSLDTLGVSDSKRPKVEAVQVDLHACMTPAREIENDLLVTMADGITAGTIDTGKVDAKIAQLDAAATTVHVCSADALNKLHAVLSPTERRALVEKVQAHWGVWRHVNHEAEVGGKEQGGRLADLAQELGLTTDQVEKMAAALQAGLASLAGKFEPKKVEEHVQEFSTAFVDKSFDAKSLTSNANGHVATCGARRMSLFYETVTPLLTPDQRTTLAQHLREHAGQQLAASGK